MLIHFGTRIRLTTIFHPLLHNQRPNIAQTLKMSATEAKSKRPICPFCSKPGRLCLCNRIQNPGLDNSVSVTILQHSLEKNHPLNSARIAKIGLKNVTVATVFDVNFEARFDIRLIKPSQESGSVQVIRPGVGEGFEQDLGTGETQKVEFESDDGLEYKRFKKCPDEKNTNFIDFNEECGLRNDISGILDDENHLKGSKFVNDDVLVSEQENESSTTSLEGNTNISSLEGKLSQPGTVSRPDEEPVVTVTISKYGVISDVAHNWVPETPTDCDKPKFDQILGSQVAMDALAKGFVVKKMQKRQISRSTELEEYEDFELEVLPRSVLLFPSEEAVDVDRLLQMNFEVKNLIVLDGTWAKAKRMYNENPWLKFLPHLKLDLDEISLYSEVRRQPKAGYLSTIESIVYTLKALEDNTEELDNLLDVFESMIGDQRRCKDERLSKVSHV